MDAAEGKRHGASMQADLVVEACQVASGVGCATRWHASLHQPWVLRLLHQHRLQFSSIECSATSEDTPIKIQGTISTLRLVSQLV